MQLTIADEHKRVALRFSIVTLIFAALLAGLVYPEHLRVLGIERRVSETRFNIMEQEMFAPLVTRMRKDLDQERPQGVMVPKIVPLPKSGISQVQDELEALATHAGFEPLEIAVDPSSLAQDPEHILIRFVASGPQQSLRDLYLALGTLAWMDRIEKVEIRATQGGVEAMFKLWAALEPEGN